jgi:hypothetical protein
MSWPAPSFLSVFSFPLLFLSPQALTSNSEIIKQAKETEISKDVVS